MPTAENGYCNGKQIVREEEVNRQAGQRRIVANPDDVHAGKKQVNLGKYMGRGPKLFGSDAGEYVKGMRRNDRI